MKCPLCNQDICEEVVAEADVQVGTIRKVTGWICKACGEIAACNVCGTPSGLPHPAWCDELQSIDDEGEPEL